MFGLWVFGVCGNEEVYMLFFVKGFVIVSFDLLEVNKNICVVFWGDEIEIFNFVKLFNSISLVSCYDVYF